MGSDSNEGKAESVDLLDALLTYRRTVTEERWLTTHILHAHLEVEACLVELLSRNLKRPERLFDQNRGPNFAMLISLCDAMGLVEEKLCDAVRALNKLRNAAAHVLNYRPSVKELAQFIAAVAGIYPLEVRQSGQKEGRRLSDFQQAREHFEGVDMAEALEMMFVSLRLLHVTVIGLIKPQDSADSGASPLGSSGK